MRSVLNLKFSDLTFINFRVKLKKNQFEEKKMRNKKCFLRHTNTLLYISWYWTVHSILFTGHPGVINVVRQTHCKQSLVVISVILIFHKCLFHYHQSSLNICVDRSCGTLFDPCTESSETVKNHLKEYELYFYFRILLFCCKNLHITFKKVYDE